MLNPEGQNGKRTDTTGRRRTNTTLDIACELATQGFVVLAMVPLSRTNGEKRPAEKWANLQYRSPEQIRASRAFRNGLGVAIIPGRSGHVAVDLDTPEASEWLAAKVREHDSPIRTRKLQTHKGQHLIFKDGGRQFRTQAGQVTPGLDVRGRGGIELIYDPGQPERKWLNSLAPAALPGWLADLLPLVDSHSADQADDAAGRRPLADHIAECLAAVSGQQHDALRGYVQELQRCEDDDAVVVRRAMDTVRKMKVYRKTGPRGGPYTEDDIRTLLLKGDARPVADATPEEIELLARPLLVNGRERRRTAAALWHDFTALVRGDRKRDKPAFGLRADGQALFYLGKEHTVYGETETGKDMFIVSSVKEGLERDEDDRLSFMWVDFEEGDEIDNGYRLLNCGLDPALLCDQSWFRYATPATRAEADACLRDILKWHPDVAVFNGVAAAYGVYGWPVKEGDSATAFRKHLVRPCLARGIATVATDHVPKPKDKGGLERYAYGGVMKLNTVNGSSYLLEAQKAIVRGGEGSTRIILTKDRPGSVKPECGVIKSQPAMRYAGTLTVKSSGDGRGELVIEIIPPQPADTTSAGDDVDGAEISDELMHAVLAAFRDFKDVGASKTAIRDAWKGPGKRQVPLAVDKLVAEKCLVSAGTSTSGRKLVYAKPWKNRMHGG